MKFKVVVHILLIGVSLSLYAQNKYKFESISDEQGLTFNNVKEVIKDHKGMIWIASSYGLNYYDAYSLYSYKKDPKDSSTLSDNDIFCLSEDRHGNLWVGTRNGLNRFNRETGQFKQYYSYPSDTKSLAGNFIRDIFCDSKGRLWISTQDGGLSLYNETKDNFTRFQIDALDDKSISYNAVFDVMEDNRGDIWFGTIGDYINVFQEEDSTFKRISYGITNGYEDPGAFGVQLAQDKQGNIWITANTRGVYRYNPLTKKSIDYSFNPETFVEGNSVNTSVLSGVMVDDNGKIFISTDGGGINVFDPETKKFDYIQNDPRDPKSLPSNKVFKGYIDDAGIHWYGSFSAGVMIYDKGKEKFASYTHDPDNPKSLNNKAVLDFLEDKDGNIWIGTDGGGLNIFDKETSTFEHFPPGEKTKLPTGVMKTIYQDHAGYIWIGTYLEGLLQFDPNTKQMVRQIRDELPNNLVWCITEDANNQLWCGTLGGGLFKLNQNRDEITLYQTNENDPNSLPTGVIFSMDITSDGILWLATVNGLISYDIENNKFNAYYNDLWDDNSLGANSVSDVYVDEKDRAWACTKGGGLCLFVEDSAKFIRYDMSTGLPSNNIRSALTDEKGNIWVATSEGISLVNIETKETKNYTLNDGLISKMYFSCSSLKTKNGDFYFGSPNGFNVFNPDKIENNKYKPKVIITDFKVLNKKVEVGEEVFGRVLLNKRIEEAEYIKLSYKARTISFEFAALNYTFPMKNKYRYKMEGFDNEWFETDAENRSVTYSNLPGREFTFLVYGSNNDGVWGDEPARLVIKVIPPFYKTFWFYTFIIIFISLALYRFFKFREEQAKRDKLFLEQKIREGEAIVEKQKQEVEEQKEEIRKREEREKEIRFQTNGLAKFSEILSENKDNLQKLWQTVISELVKYVGANLGVIYILDEESEDDSQHYLELSGAFACDVEKLHQTRFHVHEGYIGACFRDGIVVEMDKIPENYTHVSSGLGSRTPNFSLLVPIKQDEIKNGVIEIASFDKLEKYKINFLELLSKSISSHIAIIKANEKSQMMLEKSKIQAEEMQAQEEELRQNLEEMLATQEDLQRQMEQNKKMKEELNLERTLLRTILDYFPDFLYFKDKESNFIKVSKSMLPLFPVETIEEMEGKTDFDFHKPEHAQEFFDEEMNIIKTENSIIDKINQEVTKNGVEQWVSVSKMPLYDLEGNVIGTWGISKNITKFKKLELEAKEMAEKLEELQKKKKK